MEGRRARNVLRSSENVLRAVLSPFSSSTHPYTHTRHTLSSDKVFQPPFYHGRAEALLSNYRAATALQFSPPCSGWYTWQTPVSSRACRANRLPFRSDNSKVLQCGAGPRARQGASTQVEKRWGCGWQFSEDPPKDSILLHHLHPWKKPTLLCKPGT